MATSRSTSKVQTEITGFSRGYGALLLILILVMAGAFWWQLPPEIPLYFGMPYGVAQLAPKAWFWLLPGLSIIIFGVSYSFTRLPLKSVLFAPMVGWLQTLCLFLIGLAQLHIIMVSL